MICLSLQSIVGFRALEHGSRMEEIYFRPECQISDWRIHVMHKGKDASIANLLRGGNGFPATRFADREMELMFDMACKQELHDLHSVKGVYL